MVAGQVIVLTVMVALWWNVPEGVASELLSNPRDVARQFWTWIGDGTLPSALLTSLRAVAVSLVLSSTIGVSLASLSYSSKLFDSAFSPLISWANAIPKLLFISVSITVWGLTSVPGIVLATSLTVFFFYYYALQGMKAVGKQMNESLLLMGATRFWIVRNALIPSAALYLIAALRTAAPVTFTAVVFCELWIGMNGTGALIARNANLGNSAGAMAAILSCALIGFLLDNIFRRVADRVGAWSA